MGSRADFARRPLILKETLSRPVKRLDRNHVTTLRRSCAGKGQLAWQAWQAGSLASIEKRVCSGARCTSAFPCLAIACVRRDAVRGIGGADYNHIMETLYRVMKR